MRSLTSAEAVQILRRKRKLQGYHVTGRLSLFELASPFPHHSIESPLQFTKCIFDEYFSPAILHKAPIFWNQCIFHLIEISSGVYFHKGLTCKDSEFQSEVLFDAGGHNDRNAPIIFERVVFKRFVDFFDSHFSGPLILKDVRFLGGTNLLHESKGWVSFEVPPILEDVQGKLDVGRNISMQSP